MTLIQLNNFDYVVDFQDVLNTCKELRTMGFPIEHIINGFELEFSKKEVFIDYDNGAYTGTVNSEMEKNGFGKFTFVDGDIYEGFMIFDRLIRF